MQTPVRNTRNYNITDFTLPEGMQATPQELQQMVSIVNAAEGRKATVNNLLAYAVQRANDQIAAMRDAQASETAEWQKKIEADPEFGGTFLEATKNEVKRVLAQFGSPELEKILNETGLGNHPELFRFVARLAGATKEAQPGPTAGAKPNGAMTPQEVARRFFGASTAQG